MTAATGARGADLALLGGPPGTLSLVGAAARLAPSAEAAGWRLVPRDADVCVGPRAATAAAVASGARALVLVGGADGAALPAGRRTCELLAWPDAWDARAVATRDAAPLRQLFGAAPAGPPRRAGAASSAAVLRRVPPRRMRVCVVGGDGLWPFTAGGAAIDPQPWLLFRGRGDDLQRLVLTTFPRGRRGVACKVGRLAATAGAFEREARGLALAAAAGPQVARHAPALLGSGEAGGCPVSVETAAPGRRLSDVLPGRQPLATRLAHVDRVAGWLVDVGAATRSAKTRRHGDVDLPTVLEHGDLGTWNVHVTSDDFTALDWESARGDGLPLADLAYFLVDALTAIERPSADPLPAMVALLAGRSRWSERLFGWLRRGATASGVAASDVPAAVALAWRRHAASPDLRSAAGGAAAAAPHARLADAWLREPALGQGWPAWHG